MGKHLLSSVYVYVYIMQNCYASQVFGVSSLVGASCQPSLLCLHATVGAGDVVYLLHVWDHVGDLGQHDPAGGRPWA